MGIIMAKKYKKCWECGAVMEETVGTDSDGISYNYWKCSKCGEDVLTMDQLHELAEKEKKLLTVKISKWGNAVAMRIPKKIVETYNLVPGKEATIIPEKTGFKVVSRKK
jgi:hypothetical protein